MHQAVVEFCAHIRNHRPEHFSNKKVLDCGSLDINGNNRYLFNDCSYTGIDVGEGPNVDIVSLIHEFKGDEEWDTIISTEAFEHDSFLHLSIRRIVKLLKPGGMLIFTCAGPGRPEHGTEATTKSDCPLTTWDYYRNLTPVDFGLVFNDFKEFHWDVENRDTKFWGIK